MNGGGVGVAARNLKRIKLVMGMSRPGGGPLGGTRPSDAHVNFYNCLI